ncbi:MAG: 4'-phosphopantetheinyl transferase superfamily protein [Ruminococcaceae bacterium]|nr:4'-phosphopantetheinyl transferase superfamily protein [Oscillospiraceae bacterium]
MNRQENKIYVSTSIIPDSLEIKSVYPVERDSEIERCSNARVKKEKFFVWELLRGTVEEKLGIPFESLKIEKSPSGKWKADRICFSISHSDGAVAVAVGYENLGIDIESVKRHREGIEKQILTADEQEYLSSVPSDEKIRRVIEFWTKKEAYFKLLDKKSFVPQKIETLSIESVTRRVILDNKEFLLSICSEDISKKEIIYN